MDLKREMTLPPAQLTKLLIGEVKRPMTGSKSVLLKNFDTQVIHEPSVINFERRPMGLVILGISFFLLAIAFFNSSQLIHDDTFTALMHGMGGFLLCSSGIMLCLSLPIIFFKKARAYISFDKILRTVLIKNETFTFDEIKGFDLRNFGASYITLVVVFKNDKVVPLITLRSSAIQILNNLKSILESDLTLKLSNEVTRSIEPQNFEKPISLFYMLFGVVWIVVCLVFFDGIEIVSSRDSRISLPFWALGILMMALGVYRYIKADRALNKSKL